MEQEPNLARMLTAFRRSVLVAVVVLATASGDLKAVELPQQPAPSTFIFKPAPFIPDAADKEVRGLCSEEAKTELAEQAILKTYTSVALRKALSSEQEFWRFLIDPSTPYLDRMAAANQGGGLIGPPELPLLWKADAEFETLPTGVDSSPCLYVMSANLTADMWFKRKEHPAVQPNKAESKTVLGQRVDLPLKIVDDPITLEERNQSPWLWQMKRALTVLSEKVATYYESPDRYPLLVEASLRGQPANWREAGSRSRLFLTRGPHSVLWLQMIVRLALEDSDVNIAVNSSGRLYTCTWDSDYHFKKLAHAALVVILQKTQREEVAAQAAGLMEHLAREDYISFSLHLRPIMTSRTILDMGRWALDPSLNSLRRYDDFVTPICKTVDNPPFQPVRINDPKDPELVKSMKAFEEWFTKQRGALKKEAAGERPHLQSLASELSLQIE